MLSDNPDELPCGNPPCRRCGGSRRQNIRLANFNDAANGVNYQFGVPATPVAGLPALVTGGTYNTYFATASTGSSESDHLGGQRKHHSSRLAVWTDRTAGCVT